MTFSQKILQIVDEKLYIVHVFHENVFIYIYINIEYIDLFIVNTDWIILIYMAPVTYEYVLTMVCMISVWFALCVSLVLRIVRLTLMVSDVVNVRKYRYSMYLHIYNLMPYVYVGVYICLHFFNTCINIIIPSVST